MKIQNLIRAHGTKKLESNIRQQLRALNPASASVSGHGLACDNATEQKVTKRQVYNTVLLNSEDRIRNVMIMAWLKLS